MYSKGKFDPVRAVEQYRRAEVYVSGWPHALATLPPRNECLKPLEYEAERATEPIGHVVYNTVCLFQVLLQWKRSERSVKCGDWC